MGVATGGPHVGLGHEVEGVRCAWCHILGVVCVCVAAWCAFVEPQPWPTVVDKLGLLRLHERAAELRRDAWRHAFLASLGVESIKSEVRGAKMRPRRRFVEYIYQIKALEQLIKVMTVAQRHFELQKKYGTKRVFWDSSGSIGAGARS